MPFTVLDDGVGRREENALVAVRPSNQVGRTAVVAVDLDDLAMTVLVPLMTALDRQIVSDRSFHGSPFPRRYLPGLSSGQSVDTMPALISRADQGRTSAARVPARAYDRLGTF